MNDAASRLKAAFDLLGARNPEAADPLLRALVAEPDSAGLPPGLRADAWGGLAEAELARGRLDAAVTAFDRALALAPGHLGALIGRSDVALWRDGWVGWEQAIDRTLCLPILPPYSYHFLVRKACLHWIRRNTPICAAILAHLSQALDREGVTLAQHLQGYTLSIGGHLHGLLRAESLGAGGDYDPAPLPPLFLLGDSHCLAPAAARVGFAGRDWRITPRYILGLKAWHLANAQDNGYKAALARNLAALPSGAAVVVSAGDIDCRVGNGFYNLTRKTGADLAQAIPATVRGYIAHLQAAAAPYGHRLVLLAPPAPRGDLQPLGDDDRRLVPAIASHFHAALVDACQTAGLPLIDYYRLTIGPADGWADPTHYVDNHHLAGGAFQLACR